MISQVLDLGEWLATAAPEEARESSTSDWYRLVPGASRKQGSVWYPRFSGWLHTSSYLSYRSCRVFNLFNLFNLDLHLLKTQKTPFESSRLDGRCHLGPSWWRLMGYRPHFMIMSRCPAWRSAESKCFRPGARVMSCRLPKMVTSLVQNCSDVHDVHDVDHIRCAMPMKCMSCVWISEMAVWFWGGVPEAGIWGLPSLNQWSLIGAFHIWWFWCLCPAYDSLLCFAEPGQFSFWPSLFLLVWECSSTFCICFAFCRGLELLHWNLFQTSCSREPQSCFAFAMPRDKDVYFAKLAEQAERYP